MMSASMEQMPPHYRRNFAAVFVEYVFFWIAFTFIGMTTVLPAFVRELTDSAPLVGLVGTLFNAGFLLPQLLVARLINDKPRKMPFMRASMAGRIAIPILAIALWAGIGGSATATLVLFFVCLTVFSMADGAGSVPWFDIIGRAIPMRRRGRLFGAGQTVSGIAAAGAGVLVGRILVSPRFPFPTNYALLFTLSAVAFAFATVALLAIREPPVQAALPTVAQQGSSQWQELLFKDKRFRRLIICSLLTGMASLATPFYVVHAQDVLHLPQSIIGVFIVASTLTAIVASPGLGMLAERRGPQAVIVVTSALTLGGPLVALAAHLAGGGWLAAAYPLVFAFLGVTMNSWMLGSMNYLMEIAPENARSTYIGLANTILGVQALVPILGGYLLQATSYPVLFGLTAAFVVAGFWVALTLKPAVRASEARMPSAGSESI